MTPRQQYIEHLIELYFDGLTTTEQEAELREMAADPILRGESIDELRAVMSFAAVSPPTGKESAAPSRSSIKSRIVTWIATAAAVAIVSVTAWNLVGPHDTSLNTGCMAYVDGAEIDDPDEVMRIVNSELGALGEAANGLSDDVTTELSAISSAMNQDKTPI